MTCLQETMVVSKYMAFLSLFLWNLMQSHAGIIITGTPACGKMQVIQTRIWLVVLHQHRCLPMPLAV
jgi:hypothetical protein